MYIQWTNVSIIAMAFHVFFSLSLFKTLCYWKRHLMEWLFIRIYTYQKHGKNCKLPWQRYIGYVTFPTDIKSLSVGHKHSQPPTVFRIPTPCTHRAAFSVSLIVTVSLISVQNNSVQYMYINLLWFHYFLCLPHACQMAHNS